MNEHSACRHFASRRTLISGLAALGAGLALPRGPARSADDPPPRRVDVHHHFFPPGYLDHVEEVVGNKPSPLMTGWSAAQVLEHMDKTGVATAIASISPWGPHFKDAAQARQLARLCNDYAAQMSRDHPGRFGLFAAMPLPDVDGALSEVAYALDTLKADGVGLMTSYGDKWPGDPVFAPLFEELDRRKAVVYFHPNTPSCCGSLVPGAQPSMLEWPYDTGRAVVSLLLGGALAKYQNIDWIFSHAGGPVPALAGRIVNMTRNRNDLAKIAPQGVMRELTRLYYDTANATFAPTMAALLKFVPISQVLFGSDYPYYSLEENVAGLAEIALSPAERQAIDRGNAARLMPRFAG
jgi:predicted TIM-barrel fold metal-dependent hydrolase